MIGEPGKGVRDVLFIGCPYPGPVGSPLTDRGWGTDDGGDQTLEESRMNTQKQAERGHIGIKERGDGQDVCLEEGARMNLRGGEKEGTTSSSTGNIET